MREEGSIVISRRYTPMLSAALGHYMKFLTASLHREEDMDIDQMADFMEVYTTAGSLWVKAMKSQGFDQKDIAALMSMIDGRRLDGLL